MLTNDLEQAARFGFAYVPEPDPPLTVRSLLRDTLGVFLFGAFMSGVASLVAIACFASGG